MVEPPGPFSGWLAVLRNPLVIPLAGAAIIGWLVRRPLLDMMGNPDRRSPRLTAIDS